MVWEILVAQHFLTKRNNEKVFGSIFRGEPILSNLG